MATPPLSEVKRILRQFPPRPEDGYPERPICTDGCGGMCRDAAVELVRETAWQLCFRPLRAPLGDIVCIIEDDALWDLPPEEIAVRIMDRLEY